MRPNRARPARAARLTCPTQAKQSLPRARKGALRALIAGKNKPETAPGAPVQRRRRAQEVETVAVPPPKKKGKRRKSVNAFVNRRFFQRMAQWREQLSKRPDAASGLRFFEPEQHGVLRSRGVMTLGLYGVLDINAPGKRSQNKRRLYGESPAVRFASPRSPRQTPPNQDRAETKLRPNRDYAETTPKQIKTQRRRGAGRIKPVEIAKSNRAQAWAPPPSGPDCRANAPCPTSLPLSAIAGAGTLISALARRVSTGRSAAKLRRAAAMTGQSIKRPSADSGWLAIDGLGEWRAI